MLAPSRFAAAAKRRTISNPVPQLPGPGTFGGGDMDQPSIVDTIDTPALLGGSSIMIGTHPVPDVGSPALDIEGLRRTPDVQQGQLPAHSK